MRKLLWLAAFAVLAGTVVGCSGGGGASSAEDTQFQKDLAAAAAKNKNTSPSKKNALTKMPDSTAKPDTAAGSSPAPSGK